MIATENLKNILAFFVSGNGIEQRLQTLTNISER
jgi:hypothetical protein